MFHLNPIPMEIKNMAGFDLIGISVVTSNAPGKADHDIPALWHRFMTEKIADAIPGRIDTDILCAYTDYETDASGPYTTVLGCRVASLAEIPQGMLGVHVAAGPYQCRAVQGDLAGGAVIAAWQAIWQEELPRDYGCDYEVYGEHENPHDSAMEIYLSLKNA